MPSPTPPGPEPVPRLRELQYAFTAHVRDPDGAPRPADVEDRRMAIYRDLFYNNVEGFLAAGFPVLRSISNDTAWHGLVRDFFARHRSRSPYFRDIAKEFIAFLEDERNNPGDPPFLRELARYEWVETELAISDLEPELPEADPEGDLLAGVPLLSPLTRVLSCEYPVHRIGPDYLPQEAEPAYLLVYRDRDDEVAFLALNPVTMRLLQMIEADEGLSGARLLSRIAEELQHPRPEVVVSSGLEILEDLRRRGAVAGTRRTT
jgi:hypothetical protein